MTTSEMCDVLSHNIQRYEQHAATILTGSSPGALFESVALARNGAELMRAIRDRLIAADRLAEAVEQYGWRGSCPGISEALRAYRESGAKGGGACA